MSELIDVRLTGKSERYVKLLQQYGHLDEDGVNRLLLAVSEVVGNERRPVELPMLRRIAAMILINEAKSEALLEADWEMLFS